MGRRSAALLACVLVLAAAVAACDDDNGDDNGGATVPEGGGGDGLAGVEIPNAYTGLTVVALSAPTFPVRGSDGQYHVAYDLQVTNASSVDATLERVEVVDATDPSEVVASFGETDFVDEDCPACNRLRQPPAQTVEDNAIPAGEARVLLLDFAADQRDEIPDAVLHHVLGTGATSPASQEPEPLDILVAPFDLSAGTPRVIAPPVRGDNWIALNGCCSPGFPHRGSLLPLSGRLNNSQRFAIDWKRVNDEGEFYTGDRTKNESYVDYGSDIYAVADGTVVSTLDTEEANAPGVLPASDPERAAELTVRNVDGNHIVLDIGGGAYVMYAHLIRGSLLVEPGDEVEAGDVIAKLGNTGNANASHLHFQLMDGPSLIQADPLPYVIDSFVYRGQVDPELIGEADDYLSGTFLPDDLPEEGQPREEELPLRLAIVDF